MATSNLKFVAFIKASPSPRATISIIIPYTFVELIGVIQLAELIVVNVVSISAVEIYLNGTNFLLLSQDFGQRRKCEGASRDQIIYLPNDNSCRSKVRLLPFWVSATK